ncbi:hypothetical protein F4777DRAFT_65011 [Nemania sp. FL0916]|nr:hypothetical protein F4777DRAFT_65011 [Nemania sp. FL0916]
MSMLERQRELARRKRDKMEELRRKVQRQEHILQVKMSEAYALGQQKQTLIRQLGLHEIRYHETREVLERHHRRLKIEGTYGTFERNMRIDMENKRDACKEAELKVDQIEKEIEEADHSERKAQQKLNELTADFRQAQSEYELENGRLIRMRPRYEY